MQSLQLATEENYVIDLVLLIQLFQVNISYFNYLKPLTNHFKPKIGHGDFEKTHIQKLNR